jgi:hypothetical protein
MKASFRVKIIQKLYLTFSFNLDFDFNFVGFPHHNWSVKNPECFRFHLDLFRYKKDFENWYCSCFTEGWKNFKFGKFTMILVECLLLVSEYLDFIQQFIHLYYSKKNWFDLDPVLNAAQDYLSGCFEMHYWCWLRCFTETRDSL